MGRVVVVIVLCCLLQFRLVKCARTDRTLGVMPSALDLGFGGLTFPANAGAYALCGSAVSGFPAGHVTMQRAYHVYL